MLSIIIPKFTREKTEAKRLTDLDQGHTALRWQRWGLKKTLSPPGEFNTRAWGLTTELHLAAAEWSLNMNAFP